MIKNTHTRIDMDATPAEWEAFRTLLSSLTDAQLIKLTTLAKINFRGVETVSRYEMIDVLDELYWDDFYKLYASVVKD